MPKADARHLLEVAAKDLREKKPTWPNPLGNVVEYFLVVRLSKSHRPRTMSGFDVLEALERAGLVAQDRGRFTETAKGKSIPTSAFNQATVEGARDILDDVGHASGRKPANPAALRAANLRSFARLTLQERREEAFERGSEGASRYAIMACPKHMRSGKASACSEPVASNMTLEQAWDSFLETVEVDPSLSLYPEKHMSDLRDGFVLGFFMLRGVGRATDVPVESRQEWRLSARRWPGYGEDDSRSN